LSKKELFLYFINNLLIAATFFCLSIAVEPLIVPPTFVTPVWPVAGFAVCVVLLWGYRYLPAIALGELLICFRYYHVTETMGYMELSLLYILLILITLFRSAAGAFLVHRFLGKTNKYLTYQSVLKLYLLAGLIPTFLSSFLFVQVLLFAGYLEINYWVFEYLSWWFADSVGVFISLPVLLTLFALPREDWKPRILKVILPLIVTTFLMIFISISFKNFEQVRLINNLEKNTDLVFNETLKKFADSQTMDNWVPKGQVAAEFNELIKNYTDVVVLSNSLKNINFTIEFNNNGKYQQLYQSKIKANENSIWKVSKSYNYAGNDWKLTGIATSGYLGENAFFIIWWLMATGFLFISILGATMLVITGNDIRSRNLVRTRTKEIQKLNEILRESESRYKKLIEVQPVIFWKHIRGEPVLDFVSSEGSTLLGYSRSELVSLDILWNKIIHPEDKVRVLTEYHGNVSSGKRFTLKYRAVTKNGDVLWFQDYISTRIVDGKTEVVGLKIDITSDQKRDQEIEKLAYFDVLTQLPNRIKFTDSLTQSLEESVRENTNGAILYIDIDRFKFFNDSMGQYFGDRLLVKISERIQEKLCSECIISRVSGDEFAILISQKHEDIGEIKKECLQVSQLIHDSFKKPVVVKGHSFFISLSIGICIFPNHTDNVEKIIQYAGIAMYHAKLQGKNQVCIFEKNMLREVNEKLDIEKSLKLALMEEQMEVYYQPIFNDEKEVIKLESLIRWNHPKRGLLLPSVFISVAEQTGMIVELTEWIIDAVFKQIKTWQSSDLTTLPVSINISLFQFKYSGLLEMLERYAEKHQIDPQVVTLEITESIGVEDFDFTLEKLLRIKKLGFKLAIDDFGTGYSSLNYLTQMPIDTLKLDMSFVENIGVVTTADTLVEIILLMARKLGFEVIVEGIENRTQFELLKKLGCKEFQGFLVSEALNVSEIEKRYLNI